MEPACQKPGVVGLKQVLRALDAGDLSAVCLADDAEEHIRRRVIERCEECGVQIQSIESMRALGNLAGIDVGAAAAGYLHEEASR